MSRMIDENVWEDDFFTALDIDSRLMWFGLITKCADDQGRMQDNPILIRSKLFPVDDYPISNIEAALVCFEKMGKITRYKVGDKLLIQIVNWWKHQRPRWAGASKYSPPPGWVDRVRYHGQGNEIISDNWDSSGGYTAGYIDDYIAPNTIRDVKGDVKGDGEDDGDGEGETAAAAFQQTNVARLYENEIGLLPPIVADKIAAAEREYPADWIEKAIREAVRHNARKWAYVEAILKRWKIEGFANSNGSKETKSSDDDLWERITQDAIKKYNTRND